MKKSLLILGAIALTFGLASCNKQESAKDVENLVEDGFYVYGDAANATEFAVKYQLAQGINEVDGAQKTGMYEKYIALQAGKDFTLVLYSGSQKTNYGANLAEVTLDGSNDQPTCTILKGALVTGESAPTLSVKANGLYHIVLDLNEQQILVAPVAWGVSGGMNSWGYNEMTQGSFDLNSITWVITDQILNPNGEFKFKYNNGWKIELNADATVKANTNLGANMVPGGANITDCAEGGIYTISLTWSLAGGSVDKSFSYKVTRTGDLDPVDPTTVVAGLSGGSIYNGSGSWSDPANLSQAWINTEKSSIADNKGTIVCDMNPLYLSANDELKVRINGDWIGFSGISVDNSNFVAASADDNVKCNKDGWYKFQITYTWNGFGYSDVKLSCKEATEEEKYSYYVYVDCSTSSWLQASVPASKLLCETFGITAEQLTAVNADSLVTPFAVADGQSNDSWYVLPDSECWGDLYLGGYYGIGSVSGDDVFSISYGKNPKSWYVVKGVEFETEYPISWEGKTATFYFKMYCINDPAE